MSRSDKVFEAIMDPRSRKSRVDAAIKELKAAVNSYPSDSRSKVFQKMELLHGELTKLRTMMNSESEDLGTPGGAPEGWY